MAARDEIQKRIEKKKAEIAELEASVRDARIYVQALEEAVRLLPRDSSSEVDAEVTLRAGSNVSKAMEALRTAGRPMHITDLLKAIGKDVDRDHRSALSGSLSSYVRQGKVFTRPEPNVFGLLEFTNNHTAGRKEPPAEFGLDEPSKQ